MINREQITNGVENLHSNISSKQFCSTDDNSNDNIKSNRNVFDSVTAATDLFGEGIEVGTKFFGNRSNLTAAMRVYYAVRGVLSNEDSSSKDNNYGPGHRVRGANLEIQRGGNSR
jgi:hypothetical protein